jgi:ElaB/YqjD/DUF883 family membrane-anchored ribosome-binding protein|tara:strand:- start:32 stop:226 length:195 start_codon:yes stop_codon:yes gene_type:complete
MSEEIQYSIKEINENFQHFGKDIELFLEKKNKSAGTRSRKALLEISKLCKDIRKQIQDIKNAEA